MLRTIVILANSLKHSNRCIAGIDMQTLEWVRPCWRDGEDGIPWQVRQVDGREPTLLDVVNIPLADDGPRTDIQPENRRLLDGAWQMLGKVEPPDVFEFLEQDQLLLHSADKRVPRCHLQRLPLHQRKSLCLTEAEVRLFTAPKYGGSKTVNAAFDHCGHSYCLPVTDPDYRAKFPAYSEMKSVCLLTISLALPYRDDCCYKLVAGVIRLESLL